MSNPLLLLLLHTYSSCIFFGPLPCLVLVWKCACTTPAAGPAGNGTVFEHNVLVDGNGRVLSSPAWTPEARHSDCAQAVVSTACTRSSARFNFHASGWDRDCETGYETTHKYAAFGQRHKLSSAV